jgi:hypothetical protein
MPNLIDPLQLSRLHIRNGADEREIAEYLTLGSQLGLWQLPGLSAKDVVEEAKRQFSRQISQVRKYVFQTLFENQKRNVPQSGQREGLFDEMCAEVQRRLPEWETVLVNTTIGRARAEFDVAITGRPIEAITGVSFEQRPNCQACGVAKSSARYLDLTDSFTIQNFCESCARASLEIPLSRG